VEEDTSYVKCLGTDSTPHSRKNVLKWGENVAPRKISQYISASKKVDVC